MVPSFGLIDGMMSPPRSRRQVLGGLALGTTAALTAPAIAPARSEEHSVAQGSTPVTSQFVFYDPTEHQQQSYRILRNLYDEADVLFWYHFIMFTVAKGRRPEIVVRWEGIEMSHHKKLRDGVYRVHGHNLSYPRDPTTTEFVGSVTNPVTGRTVSVPAMTLTEDPGYVYTPQGVIPLDDPEAPARIRFEQFRIEGDVMKIEQVRQPPASWPAEFIETSTNWSPLDQFNDPNILSLPAGTSGGYIFPWPALLKMGDQEGHMFATWSGIKLSSVDELPRSFRERAERDHPELLSVDMNAFKTPLPEPLKSI